MNDREVIMRGVRTPKGAAATSTPTPFRRGFALVDFAAVVAVVGVLLSVLLVAGTRNRGLAYQAESLANLKQIGTVTGYYGNDNADRMWGFTWRAGAGPYPTEYADLQAQAGSGIWTELAAAQAVDIIRRRAKLPTMPVIHQWIPYIVYSHLPLADYLGTELPLRFMVAPGDRNRMRWSGDPAGFRGNLFLPLQPDGSDASNWRWPYSSSYELPPAFYSPDLVTAGVPTIVQGPTHSTFQIVGTGAPSFGQRRLTEVVHPSQKVLMYESAQNQGSRAPVFFAYFHARVPLVMVDGSAAVRATATANLGFQPANPNSPFPTLMNYSPLPWEPPLASGSAGLKGFYRWTRRGLTGRDFDGQEVPSP